MDYAWKSKPGQWREAGLPVGGQWAHGGYVHQWLGFVLSKGVYRRFTNQDGRALFLTDHCFPTTDHF
jgi:hypothetical protein